VLKVGLTGGLACGKTFVGEELQKLGCLLIQADELGHAVLEPGGEAYDGVVREFGPSILAAEGRIDRAALAAQAFGDPQRLARLNALVHPPVVRREEELIARHAAAHPHSIAVVEAAVLIESGSRERFDKIVVVTCGKEQQMARALRRPGAGRDDVQARLERQMPIEEKRKFADFVIDTNGEKEDTLRQTRAVYEALRRFEQ
jgi:dephospho-CoA kinase